MNSSVSNFSVKINKNYLIITNGCDKKIDFPSAIQQIEKFDEAIVVRIHPKTKKFLNDNVFGVSYDGKILWQIESLKHVVYRNSPFTGMTREGDNVKLFNWDGTDLIVNPITGKIIKKGYSK